MNKSTEKSIGTRTAVKYNALTDPRLGRRLFLLCFTAYFFTYLGRLNYSAALADIVTSGVMERDAAGLISTAFFLMYGMGQLVNGFMGDKISPFFMVGSGIFLSGIMNCTMFFVTQFFDAPLLYILVWGINGFSQSAIWSPLVRIVSSVLPESQRVKGCINMFAAISTGTLGSYLLSTVLLYKFDWRAVFIVPGILLFIVGLGWFAATRGIVKQTEYRVEVPKRTRAAAVNTAEKKPKLWGLLASSGVVFVFVMVMMMAMIKEGVTTWTPTFIADSFNTTAAFSVLLTTLLPLANLAAQPLTRLINEKWLHNELRSSSVFFAIALIAITFLYVFGTQHIAIMLVCLAVTSFSMIGINSLLISLVPMRFGIFGLVSSVTGIINSIAYTSNSLSSVIVGQVTSRYPMTVMVLLWIFMCLIGITFGLVFAGKWRKFVDRTEELKRAECAANPDNPVCRVNTAHNEAKARQVFRFGGKRRFEVE
nr:MFS transporter [Clostridia bacterium]